MEYLLLLAQTELQSVIEWRYSVPLQTRPVIGDESRDDITQTIPRTLMKIEGTGHRDL